MDSNYLVKYEGTSLQLLRADNGSLERKNNMSFCCFIRNKNGVILCSDSRETFANGTFDENRQKVFITGDNHHIYACTGIIHYDGKDYVAKVKDIMNNSSMSIVERLISISDMMKNVSESMYDKTKMNQRFDMFIIDIKDFTLYVLSVENGILVDYSVLDECPTIQTMGRQVELFHYYHSDEYENDSIKELTKKAVFLVKRAALKESIETLPTINENTQWILVDCLGNIRSSI